MIVISITAFDRLGKCRVSSSRELKAEHILNLYQDDDGGIEDLIRKRDASVLEYFPGGIEEGYIYLVEVEGMIFTPFLFGVDDIVRKTILTTATCFKENK